MQVFRSHQFFSLQGPHRRAPKHRGTQPLVPAAQSSRLTKHIIHIKNTEKGLVPFLAPSVEDWQKRPAIFIYIYNIFTSDRLKWIENKTAKKQIRRSSSAPQMQRSSSKMPALGYYQEGQCAGSRDTCPATSWWSQESKVVKKDLARHGIDKSGKLGLSQ